MAKLQLNLRGKNYNKLLKNIVSITCGTVVNITSIGSINVILQNVFNLDLYKLDVILSLSHLKYSTILASPLSFLNLKIQAQCKIHTI